MHQLISKNRTKACQPHSSVTERQNPWSFCIAPMMAWSDMDCRYFWRLLSKHARLYTEMVASGAILYGNTERFLRFNTQEHPLALQLGGSDPEELARCAEIAEGWGYDEVNLNCGCPSDKVQKGKIGAVLMHEPDLVAECIHAMQSRCEIPVTVKQRIGVDDRDSYESLHSFVQTVAQSGCRTFIIHARKAWLKGLSPKENREIPPLQYDIVRQIKRDFPKLNIVINGGIDTLDQCQDLLTDLDGVMIGREAYNNPYMLATVDALLFGEEPHAISRKALVTRYAEYCETRLAEGVRLNQMTRHILGLFNGQAGARLFRRHLSEHANKKDANIEVLQHALSLIRS